MVACLFALLVGMLLKDVFWFCDRKKENGNANLQYLHAGIG
jgi:hypothetical protein